MFTIVSKRTLLCIGLLAAQALVLLALSPVMLQSFNADHLYLADLYQDLFINHRASAGWALQQAPSFFPDMAIFFLCYSLADELGWAYILYAGCFVYGGQALLWLAFKPWCEKRPEMLPWLLAGGLLFLSSLRFSGLWTSSILAPAFHSGYILGGLALFSFFSHGLRAKPGPASLAMVVMLVAACHLSDPVFTAAFALPSVSVAVALGFGYKPGSSNLMGFALAVVMGIAVGFAMQTWVSDLHQQYPVFRLLHVPIPSIQETGKRWMHLAGTGLSTFNIARLPFLSVLLGLGIIFYRLSRREIQQQAWALMAFFQVMFLSLAVIAVGKGMGLPYFHAVFLFIPALAWMLLAFRLDSAGLSKIFKVAAAAGLACVVLNADLLSGLEPEKLKRPYPDWVRAVDDFAGREGYKAGYAEYWKARPLRLYSRRGLLIAPVSTGAFGRKAMAPGRWISNLQIFEETPRFDFVLTDGLDVDIIRNEFGWADKVAVAANLELWVYDNPGFRNFWRKYLFAWRARPVLSAIKSPDGLPGLNGPFLGLEDARFVGLPEAGELLYYGQLLHSNLGELWCGPEREFFLKFLKAGVEVGGARIKSPAGSQHRAVIFPLPPAVSTGGFDTVRIQSPESTAGFANLFFFSGT